MNKKYTIAAVILILIMGVISFLGSLGNSATMDELAHIPSGYSYLKFSDYRLNPEHPPLAKDLATAPLLFLNLKFPTDKPLWTEQINAQWDAGGQFLYGIGNDADKMIFWSHFGLLFIMLALGWFVFMAVSEWYSPRAGLLALFFYAFSPTILGHGPLVTTDVAAAFGIFVAIYYYLRFLKNPGYKSLIYAGIAFGICFLMKFSAFLIIPLFAILGIIKMIQKWNEGAWKAVKTYILGTVLIGVIGLLVIFPLYFHHTYNYPPERQLADTVFNLSSHGMRTFVNITVWMADKPVLRAWAQYFLGLLMVIQRASGGNTTYFLGEVSNTGWHYYFPTVYLLKEPLSFVILIFLSLIFWIFRPFRKKEKEENPAVTEKISIWKKLGDLYLVETALLLFLAIYWGSSIKSNLNIGVRHLMPTFPLAYALVAGRIDKFLKQSSDKKIFKPAIAVLGLLLAFQAFSTLRAFPYFISYFNETVGIENGYKYAADSNYDWGQDLKRLVKYTNENNIDKIIVDYFGAGNPHYYLKDKLAYRGDPEVKWLALSATFLQGFCGKPVQWFINETRDKLKNHAAELGIESSDENFDLITHYSGYDQNVAARYLENISNEAAQKGKAGFSKEDIISYLTQNTYYSLCGKEPFAKAGYSIFIYKLN